jgi:subtilisin family serine protease
MMTPAFRKVLVRLAAALLAFAASALAATSPVAPPQSRPDRIIVRLKPGQSLDAVHRSLGTRTHRTCRPNTATRLEVVQLPAWVKPEQALRAFQALPGVQYAEPDYLLDAQIEPNDIRYADGSLWHLRNRGGSGGLVGADIDAAVGWDTQRDASGIVVAVIDTGVRYTHEDLVGNMWVNPGESGADATGRDRRTNGIDDDRNGYIDDVHGINAINGTGNPMDDHGHGTHVAGTVGATANNSVGVAGVAWRVRLMACKYLTRSATGSISDAIECITYARANGARVINASWGSYSFHSQALRDAIGGLRDAGIIFVAAAGNSQGDNDVRPLYPASYEFDNIISVAASDRTDWRAPFTNWGRTTVDIAAGGVAIVSTWGGSNSDYRPSNGTSMAAPQVTGAVALVRARYPTLTYQQVIQRILDGAEPLPAFTNRTVTGGRLNLARALAGTTPPPPPPPPPPPAGSDVIWVDDAIPTGAWTTVAGGDAWNWVTANPAPFSQSRAHQSALVAGYHDHSFQKASAGMAVQAGDTLFVYVYVDPSNPPREIMVSWSNGSWEHRAYWGENLINYGANGTAGRRYMGPVPAGGAWVRLEVPASSVGLEGTTVTGMSFSLYGGRVTWDAAGRRPQQ